ncbi:YtpR family tRNA-binding protein [Streptococcus sp. NLN76]|uniref:YtpR family tRNA-binding protein n=1 Tax=Streptococcus sp. NLN76 TaxID=2822800 RepID=UPI0018A9AC11|nr:DUF4479 and tRNA-binding domain-containing protein [Streptococcus sp. NLN76]MBF8969770.1 DUF4479 and tRNA-binding domain-containing protein [Streptococcus sp. NLN76]
MLFTYNPQGVGDVLMVVVADDQGQAVEVEKKGAIARVLRADNEETVAWNFFQVSDRLILEGSGQQNLSDADLVILNDWLAAEGFEERVANFDSPRFVVGQIVEMEAHPDSDHLNICQVAVGQDKTVQIVAGAPNARVGLKTIVALPGAMMPKGNLIFPGQLRGVASFGMMCSPRELALPNAPQKRGIIELAEETPVGQAFDPAKHWSA